MSKQSSRRSAVLQLETHLKRGTKPVSKNNLVEREYTKEEIAEMQSQIEVLKRRINGESISKTKTPKIRSSKSKDVDSENYDDGYVIKIYSVKFGFVNKAAKKQTKGKSKAVKKKMKKEKNDVLVQTVKNRPGLINRYKSGLMGYSPKNHTFKMVKV
jgi:hypothetical protein